jgi:hypothetical protein
MSLKTKLNKIEREAGQALKGIGELSGSWLLGGLLVGTCILVDTCDKKKEHKDYKYLHKATESIYENPSPSIYTGKNIKSIYDKF